MPSKHRCSPDDLYEAIVGMHDGLTDEESERANAKLILILAQRIGDAGILREAAQLARKNTLGLREKP